MTLLVIAIVAWIILGVVVALTIGRVAGARNAEPVGTKVGAERSAAEDSDRMAA